MSTIFSSLPSPDTATANPLTNVGNNERNLLLTIHVLYPNEFLAALDLLDRGLVARLKVADAVEDAAPATPSTAADIPKVREALAVYYVRSAQQHQRYSRIANASSSIDNPASYEVRLDSWNCSCPAFAFAAFPPALSRPTSSDEPGVEMTGLDDVSLVHSNVEAVSEEEELGFGGLTFGHVPVCKHLLACVLVERCGLFSTFVEEKEVSVEEAAGWAAGWGL